MAKWVNPPLVVLVLALVAFLIAKLLSPGPQPENFGGLLTLGICLSLFMLGLPWTIIARTRVREERRAWGVTAVIMVMSVIWGVGLCFLAVARRDAISRDDAAAISQVQSIATPLGNIFLTLTLLSWIAAAALYFYSKWQAGARWRVRLSGLAAFVSFVLVVWSTFTQPGYVESFVNRGEVLLLLVVSVLMPTLLALFISYGLLSALRPLRPWFQSRGRRMSMDDGAPPLATA